MTKARLAEVGSVTSEAIAELHRQLESMPGREEELDDPDNLKVRVQIPIPSHTRNITHYSRKLDMTAGKVDMVDMLWSYIPVSSEELSNIK
jgi:hypothetical protein